jgi:hypothetical protein
MTNPREWLAGKLYEMDVSPLIPSNDVRLDWLAFTCELEVAGDVLKTFEDDIEAAVTVRDRLCSWARVWSRWHPEPAWRPWYGAVAIAAEAGNWDGVGRLCRALMEEQEQ